MSNTKENLGMENHHPNYVRLVYQDRVVAEGLLECAEDYHLLWDSVFESRTRIGAS